MLLVYNRKMQHPYTPEQVATFITQNPDEAKYTMYFLFDEVLAKEVGVIHSVLALFPYGQFNRLVTVHSERASTKDPLTLLRSAQDARLPIEVTMTEIIRAMHGGFTSVEDVTKVVREYNFPLALLALVQTRAEQFEKVLYTQRDLAPSVALAAMLAQIRLEIAAILPRYN